MHLMAVINGTLHFVVTHDFVNDREKGCLLEENLASVWPLTRVITLVQFQYFTFFPTWLKLSSLFDYQEDQLHSWVSHFLSWVQSSLVFIHSFIAEKKQDPETDKWTIGMTMSDNRIKDVYFDKIFCHQWKIHDCRYWRCRRHPH